MSMIKSFFIATALTTTTFIAPLAHANPSAEEVVNIKTNADITVGLNGLVCDFCSIALNKTFKKNEAVAETYVDLDTKTLSVILKEGATLNDADVTQMVIDSGYNVVGIQRKAG